jgi:hypothetical protein
MFEQTTPTVEAATSSSGEQIDDFLEEFHGRPRRPIRRGPGKRMVDGRDFRLADEVRHIQRCATRHDGRFVTLGQLIFFSTETGDALGGSRRAAGTGRGSRAHPHRGDPCQLHHRLEGELPYRGGGIHLRRSQDPRIPSHPRIPNAEVGARRARRLKFQISLARTYRSSRPRRPARAGVGRPRSGLSERHPRPVAPSRT